MRTVELYAAVRRAVFVQGLSQREAARRFGLSRVTVAKMMQFSIPPGYRRSRPPRRPKLEPYLGVLDQLLSQDTHQPKKQRHTAWRLFERLREEHGYAGGYTTVKDYVREKRLSSQEMFVPLSHPPGHAQADFGEAEVVIAGTPQTAHFFVMALPHSDDAFVMAFPGETTESFCAGHNAAFAYFGGVPARIVYDNTKLAVARILGNGTRKKTRVFSELQSHYLFEERFARPAKGNDKGKVEGLVGYARRNFMVPMPRANSFEDLNVRLVEQCQKRRARRLRGQQQSIGERFEMERQGFLPLPTVPYDACDKVTTRVTSLSLVRYRSNDYSVPTAYGHRQVLVKGYVDEVVICCGPAVIARHGRCYGRERQSTSRSIIWHCSNTRPMRWSKRLRCNSGNCPQSSANCVICWKCARAGAANVAASANTSKFCGCWNALLLTRSPGRSGRRCGCKRSPLMPSSIWCCAASRTGQPTWISPFIPICRLLKSPSLRFRSIWDCSVTQQAMEPRG